MQNQNNTPSRQRLFTFTQTANALERIAAGLEALAVTSDEGTAVELSIAASELAHHADAIREASGLSAAIEANLDSIKSNL